MDAAANVFVAWNTVGSDADLRVRKLSITGAAQWLVPNGVAVSTAAHTQANPWLLPDGAGGIDLAWQDARSLVNHIEAQRVGATGALGDETVGVPGGAHFAVLDDGRSQRAIRFVLLR